MVTPEPRFRAIVKRVFAVTGRGTAVCVDIIEGTVRAGDKVLVPTSNGCRRAAEVRSVEFADIDIGRPTPRAEVGLLVGDLPPSEVAVGREVSAAIG